jgi:hypothetical protein
MIKNMMLTQKVKVKQKENSKRNSMDNNQSELIQEFLQVAYSGDISRFNRLMPQLSLEAINQPDGIGKTALILAAEDGHLEKVNALIHAG